MIAGVVICPAAPFLITALAPALAAEQAELVTACRSAVTALNDRADELVLIGPGAAGAARWRPEAPADLGPSPFGRGVEAGSLDPTSDRWPPAAWVARALWGRGPLSVLEPGQAGRPDPVVVDTALALTAGAGRIGVLVLADGATCHGDDAPTAADARSDAFEGDLAEVLAAGRPDALADWSAAQDAVATALGSTAAAPLAALAVLTGGRHWTAEARYFGAPFGVGYHLAQWWP